MHSRRYLLIICILLFLSVIILSLHLSRISPQPVGLPREEKKIYYLPSLDYLRLISGTHKPLFAQALFIKGILEISEKVPDRVNYFSKLFKTAVNLDPQFNKLFERSEFF
jgi:hypothetical protein